MKTVVLTGGIACGKTTAGKMFEGLGYVFLSADKIVEELYGQKKVQRLLAKNFGNEIVKNGRVQRKILGKIVFSDKKKLAKLNSLVHPLVFSEIKKLLSRFKKTNKIVIVEVPLFFESKSKIRPDFVVAVKCSKKRQVERLEKKGLSRKEALARINSQLPAKEKAKKADFVINNSNGKKGLERQVGKFFGIIADLGKDENRLRARKRLLAQMEKGFDGGKLLYADRGELYERNPNQ